ncbi:hypothetical protein LHM76_001434 [Listeria monocytogenes]|nr:hypothetical protein [Listeria monocytogenes]EII4616120.1 hypothetical protein [Listeria monocytogenes]
MKEFHASSYIFNAFYEDFLASSTSLEKQIEELKSRPKAKVEKSFAILPDSEGRELYFYNERLVHLLLQTVGMLR